MSRGRHRRPRISLIPRRVSRLSVALTAGGAGIAAPLLLAGNAHAAPVSAVHTAAESPQTQKSVQQQKSGENSADRYTVVSGDTLYGIATAHDVDGGWKSLYQANRETVGDDPDLILPGQRLTLEAPQASRSGDRTEQGAAEEAQPAEKQQTSAEAATQSYPDNLDGWIREALSIMKQHGIPGTYEGIHRNIIRESGGDPNAINNWDINAQNGTPSIGLLQVIKPTFDAYHVPGTVDSQYDPVANIVAACNYAADRYGSIDNVNGPY
ncbi:LysM peptidoglycan-binding domain-containing protein [Streptomyces sp. JJ36]|uniref:transglycosylase SLT domain-containing protein n=1 Tax=Streptomyces sp. JJ36 TaxID=2736645 RepID=UPI001F3B08FD|nr:LysM peptidoglycan-binding domain-containing protein [Streptomyces sp. JJ36]MCF6525630.1 LysM peptidoglycan-binding domain-containing protein [Streptomyces sp. JJ36]